MKKLKIKSIYTKILLMTIVIIIAAATVSAAIMSKMLYDSIADSRIEEIEKIIDDTAQTTIDYLYSCDRDSDALSFEANWGDSSDRYYYNLLSKIAAYNEMMNVTIFISDDEGTIQLSYPLLPGNTVPKGYTVKELPRSISVNFNYYDGKYHFKERSQFEKALKMNGYIEDRSDYYGLFSDVKDRYVTVSKGLNYYNKTEAEWQVVGSILVAIPMPELAEARNSLIWVFLVSTVIMVAIDIIATSILMRQITKPIKELDNGAKRLASGDFTIRIEKTTDDEFGTLVESFNRMTDSLSKMDESKTEFISNVSHELRTPITSIKGFIEAILDGVVPEEKMDYYLGLCRDEVERMNTLINELLDMTRIEFAKSNLFEVFDINALITEQLIKMEPQISGKKIDVELNYEKDKQYVCAGKASVLRVIINLVHNSIKFTPEGGVITVSVRETGEKVEISVADTGIGISEEEVDKIFERFYKSDKSRGMDKTGTGLGLAIVKKILDSHGESIECHSKQGEGTTFIFTLAAAKEPENKQ
ncbi:MAG: HAMP domain-containing histidine kinase [Clostridia bacterium]|nr:HAMP domain-containing histidine kinase [Clostridia bacterium]